MPGTGRETEQSNRRCDR
jgi:transposase